MTRRPFAPPQPVSCRGYTTVDIEACVRRPTAAAQDQFLADFRRWGIGLWANELNALRLLVDLCQDWRSFALLERVAALELPSFYLWIRRSRTPEALSSLFGDYVVAHQAVGMHLPRCSGLFPLGWLVTSPLELGAMLRPWQFVAQGPVGTPPNWAFPARALLDPLLAKLTAERGAADALARLDDAALEVLLAPAAAVTLVSRRQARAYVVHGSGGPQRRLDAPPAGEPLTVVATRPAAGIALCYAHAGGYDLVTDPALAALRPGTTVDASPPGPLRKSVTPPLWQGRIWF